MMRTRQKVLIKAQELVSGGWCKGTMARDSMGLPCATLSAVAVKFCAAGAIERAARDVLFAGRNSLDVHEAMQVTQAALEAENDLKDVLGTDRLDLWNDSSARTLQNITEAMATAAGKEAA